MKSMSPQDNERKEHLDRVEELFLERDHESKDSLDAQDVRFLQVLSRIIADQLERQELEATNHRLQIEATGVDALLAALEARDGYTGNHSQAVVELSRAVAQHLGLLTE